MEINREEILDMLKRVTPEVAANETALHEASAEAVSNMDRVLNLANEAAKGALGYHAQRETRVRFILNELVRLRKNALRRLGAYRTLAQRAADHRAFYG
jgi:hypothetical protein